MSKRTCGICHKELPPQSRGRPRKYCPDCAAAKKRVYNTKAWKSKVRSCAHCGVQWCNIGHAGRGTHGPIKYCTDKCREDARSERYTPIPRKKHWYGLACCSTCNCLFERTKSRRTRCSSDCRPPSPDNCVSLPTVYNINCRWCGKSFIAFGRGRSSTYCSTECQYAMFTWRRDEDRPLARSRSCRLVYRTCPNPGCARINIGRPGRAKSTCNEGCELAFRLHQMNGGHSPNIGKTRGWVSPSRRLTIYERDKWTCQICYEPVDPTIPGGLYPDGHTLDHIVPRTEGGSDEDRNLQLAHALCNSVIKGTERVGSQLRLIG